MAGIARGGMKKRGKQLAASAITGVAGRKEATVSLGRMTYSC
mgnify:FL=1